MTTGAKTFGVYEVIGRRRYRTHEPGTIFEATLSPDMEARAIARGAIRLLRREPAEIDPAKFDPPVEWRSRPTAEIEAPTGASNRTRGGSRR